MTNPFFSQKRNLQDPLRKRSLKELDTVLDEVADRNPEFMKILEDYIKEQLAKDNKNGQKNPLSRRYRSS
jgi:hypothetical protein